MEIILARIWLVLLCLIIGALIGAILGRTVGNILAWDGSRDAPRWMTFVSTSTGIFGTLIGLSATDFMANGLYLSGLARGLYGDIVLVGLVSLVILGANFWDRLVVLPVRWFFRRIFRVADWLMGIPHKDNPCDPDN